MKKLTILFLILFMTLFVVTGCGSSNNSQDEAEKAANTEESQSKTASTDVATAKETETDSSDALKESESSSTEPSEDKAPIDIKNVKDGTYEGVSNIGMHLGLKVSVEVKGGQITNVSVLEHAETDGVGTRAIETLPAKIVETQSLDVEIVSGATLSSNAIIDAIEIALSTAE